MNGLNKHLGADGIRLHVQCWLTHANIQHFINKAIKFAVTFRDDVNQVWRWSSVWKVIIENVNLIRKPDATFRSFNLI